MKIDKVFECPKCKGNNTRPYQYTDVNLWDDGLYEMINEEYENPVSNFDYIDYKCKCDDCGNYFEVRVALQTEIISYEIKR